MNVDTVDILEMQGMLHDDQSILDLGCRSGAWGETILNKGYKVDYLGVDVSLGVLLHRKAPLKFKHLNVYSSFYNPAGNVLAEEMSLPIQDNSFDLVICHSLFTHLGSIEVARRYISEIKRVLRNDGYLWITFFQSPPNKVSNSIERTVYSNKQIEDLLNDFHIFYKEGGETTDYNDQLMIGCELVKG